MVNLMQSNLYSLLGASSLGQPALALATVSGQVDDWLLIEGIPQSSRVRCAASCLLSPELGDTVLICDTGREESSYILAILVRASAQTGVLNLPGGAHLHCSEGQLNIETRQFSVQSNEQIDLETATLKVSSHTGELRIKNLTGWFDNIKSHARNIDMFTKKLSTTVGLLIQKATDSFRWIESTDETRAGRIRLQVKGRYFMQARQATVLAEETVKIDGQKIDLG
jgi:hypothetical protein